MKSALIMFALVFSVISCTQQAPETSPEDSKPGDDRSFNPITVEQNSDLKISILNVCAALEEKENVMEDSRNQSFPVTYQDSDCSGKLHSAVTHEVWAIRESGRWIFQNNDRNFPMTEAETINSGVMKEICANLLGLTNPLAAGNGSQMAIEFKAVDTSYCRNDSQNVCLQIMKGRLSADAQSFKVNENTLISFRTARGGRTGFYNYKNVKTYGTCGEGKYRTKIVTFN